MDSFQRTAWTDGVSRRGWMAASVACGAAACAAGVASEADDAPSKTPIGAGGIRHSIAFWCFQSAGDKWDLAKTAQVARSLGFASVELVDPDDWGTLKRFGLVCALAPNGMPGAPFMKGFNNPKYRDEVVARTLKAVDACAEAGFPNVIAFTGYKWRDAEDSTSGEMSPEEGAEHCVRALKMVAGRAESKGVNVCLEQLNTRDDTHPMKGHPGYQGDDVDYVAEIVRRVGSPRVRLLFDVYHVQVMNGDVMRRIEQYKDLLGHVHVAGCPGRGELDDDQEINYPAVAKRLAAVGYRGFIGHEFIPTRDPLAGLRQSAAACRV